jgi:hypothetical protein
MLHHDRRSIRAALAGLGEPMFIPLPERDRVALSRRKLPTIAAGRFYLRGRHVRPQQMHGAGASAYCAAQSDRAEVRRNPS